MIQIDMEMPKSCSVCPMRHTCKVSDEWDEFDYCCNGRLEGCPLKEVSQEPILDKLRAEIKAMTSNRGFLSCSVGYIHETIDIVFDKYKAESEE